MSGMTIATNFPYPVDLEMENLAGFCHDFARVMVENVENRL